MCLCSPFWDLQTESAGGLCMRCWSCSCFKIDVAGHPLCGRETEGQLEGGTETRDKETDREAERETGRLI